MTTKENKKLAEDVFTADAFNEIPCLSISKTKHVGDLVSESVTIEAKGFSKEEVLVLFNEAMKSLSVIEFKNKNIKEGGGFYE
jgi:hypothetical protein